MMREKGVMSDRKIEGIYRGEPLHMVGDGFRVSTYFPSGSISAARSSPFILLDYHRPFSYPPAGGKRRGVGAHPHRGFETVTIAYQGSIAHRDSAGNGGVINPGDVQWMTAASGILHEEYHETEFARRGGAMHMIQLWVNLPRAYKMSPPKYQALLSEQMGTVDLPDNSGVVRVIAGEFNGTRGPASTFTPINLWDLRLNAGGVAEFTLPQGQTTALLVLQGGVKINDPKLAQARDFVLFENGDGQIRLEAAENSILLLLSGEPIAEPVVQYGPFVMNTEEEIYQAVEDYRSGRMGVIGL
jgi:redox-sensitive bicupin YhaK (pirin superfamily)